MVGGQAGGPGPSTSPTPTPPAAGGGVVTAPPPPSSTTPLLNLHSVLTLQQDAIISSCYSNIDNCFISLLLTDKKDILVLKLEKSANHTGWSQVKSKLFQLEWFENVSNKGCVLGFCPGGKTALIITDRLNIYTFDALKFLQQDNDDFSDNKEDIKNYVKQVFIGPQKPVLESACHIVSWINHEGNIMVGLGNPAGAFILVNITKGSLVGKMQLETGATLESMQLYQDDAKDCHFVIFKHSENYLRLLVEQKSLGYTWSSGGTGVGSSKEPSSLGQHNSHHSLHHSNSHHNHHFQDHQEPLSLPDVVESRGRLSSIKQMSVGKITNLRNRIAEGRKLLRSKSESDDLMIPDKPVTITTEVGMNTLVNVETTPDRDLIATFYPALFQYLHLDATLEPVQQSTRWLPSTIPGDIKKLLRTGNLGVIASKSTESATNSLHLVTTLTGNKTQNTVLQRLVLPAEECVLALWPLNLMPTPDNSNSSSPKSTNSSTPTPQKSPFRNLVCVTTDQNGKSETTIVNNVNKTNNNNNSNDAKSSPDDVIKKFASLNVPGAGSVKAGSTKESLLHKCVRKEIDALRQECDKLISSYVVVTNKQVYILSWKEHPVDYCIQLSSESEGKHTDQIIKVFGLEKTKIQELAGDLKLCSDDFTGAKNLYRLAGLSILKTALKLAVFGCVDQLLTYLQVALNNRNLEATHRETVHLSNLALISYHQQILKLNMFTKQRVELQFLQFLQSNRYYDKQLMVTQGVNSEAWGILSKIVPSYALHNDLNADLVNWMEKITMSNPSNSQFGGLLKMYLGPNWEAFINMIVQMCQILTNVTVPDHRAQCHTLAYHLKSFLCYLSWSQLASLAAIANPAQPQIFFHLKDEVICEKSSKPTPPRFSVDALNLYVHTLLHLINKHSLRSSACRQLPTITQDSDENSGCDYPSSLELKENQLCSGYSHVIFHNQGKLLCWGSNSRGATGLQPSYAMHFPPTSLEFFSKLNITVLQVSCGKHHSIVLTDNGLYSWGCNQYGQLGLGAEVVRTSQPLRINLDNIIQVECGQYHSVALDSRGQVFTWGWAIHGQLGHNSIHDVFLPKPINSKKIACNIKQISAGYAHTLFLRNDGLVYACGLGMFGQLGTGGVAKSYVPVLTKLPSPVDQISAGYFFSMACSNGNLLYQWGSHPQILRFEALQRKKGLLPTNVPNNNTAANTNKKINIGEGEAATSKMNVDDENSETPANNSEDQVPDPNIETTTESPVSLTADIPQVCEQHLLPQVVETGHVTGRIISFSAGSQHLMILTDAGAVYTWGRNLDGQLGHGGRAGQRIPTKVAALEQDHVIYASCGSDYSICVLDSETVIGWGSNTSAQLGKPPLETGKPETKTLLMKTSKRILRLQQGLQNSCDVPKPIPGITKPNVYGGRMTMYGEPVPAKDLEYFARKPVQGLNLEKLEENEEGAVEILQQTLLRTLKRFHHYVDTSDVLRTCLTLDNHSAAILLYELGGKYKEAFELILQCLTGSESSEHKVVVLNKFYDYLRAVHGNKDFRSIQTKLFGKLILHWKKNNLEFLWLESELLSRSTPGDIGSLVYILFCSPPETTDNANHNLDQDGDLVAKPLDCLSPEFLLKLGQQFTKVSQKIGISSRLSSDSNGLNSSPQESLKQILDSLNQN